MCANAHAFQKWLGCALIGACALIRTNTVFMIWDDSEEKLLQFFEDINKFHETIKFTYNYSKTNAVFLDVKNEKSQDGNLCTSVFEKDTNVHQYVEFSSCHPLSCKKGIPYSQA